MTTIRHKIFIVFIFVCAVIADILLVNAYVVLTASSHIPNDADDLKEAQTAIILGARVYSNGQLSPILKERVDTALQLYQAGIVEKLLITGDNGRASYNEVVPVRTYLLARGIPERDVFLDYAGFDTYDSMYRARAVFEVESAVVVTQSFHLARAVYLADAVGMDVQGVAPHNGGGMLYNSLREIPARVKAVGDVLFKSTPTYLGERIPITGDGRASWGE